MLIHLSDAFGQALKSEIDRLVNEGIENYFESKEYYQELDRRVVAEFEKIHPFIVHLEPRKHLELYLSPDDSDVSCIADIEDAIGQVIAENDEEQLNYLLARLNLLASKVRKAISTKTKSCTETQAV